MRAATSEAPAERTWHGLEDLRGTLRTFLARHCADEHEVEDVIQETYMRAARYRSRLTAAGRLKPWAMRIALNVLSDGRRRGHRLTCAGDDEESFESEARHGESDGDEGVCYLLGDWTLDRENARRQLLRGLATLRAEDRAVLDSFYGGAQSCRVTGRECGIPDHLVKVRLYRARQRLVRAIRRRLVLEEPLRSRSLRLEGARRRA